MIEVHFDFDWVDPQGARGDELRATWSRFEILVDETPITRVYDASSKTVRENVYLPLYPFAEWIAFHWWPLLFEIESPHRTTHVSYQSRHCVANAREGFALPGLMIEPRGESVKLSWKPATVPHSHLEFLSEGGVHTNLDSLRENLTDLIEAVLGRLDASGISDTALEREWLAIRSLSDEEGEFCKAAASLGLDPFSVGSEISDAIVRVATELPPELLNDFYSSVSVENIAEEAAGVLSALKATAKVKNTSNELIDIKGTFNGKLNGYGPPWQQGYRIARDLRDFLNIGQQPLPTFSELGQALTKNEKKLAATIIEPRRNLLNINSILGYNEHRSPGFVISPGREEARRFAFCRSLFEHITSTDPSPALVTRARTDRQKRNRAFAAEFLLPANVLRKRIKSDLIAEEDLDEVAAEFGVSWPTAQYQLYNHNIASIAAA